MKRKYSYAKVTSIYQDLRNERTEWEAEWRQISDFLLPGRGIYQLYTKPRKRKLTSQRTINTVAEDALYVLTSGMHGRLTSPAIPWFELRWADTKLNDIDELKAWLQNANKILHESLHASNFYSIISSFYVEYVGFGTGSMYVGEDSDTPAAPFRFELLTAGEYAFTVGTDGRPSVFCRTIFMSTRQLVKKFPETASSSAKKRVTDNKAGIDKTDVTVIEFVTKDTYMDKPYTRYYYEVTGNSGTSHTGEKEPLEVSGFYEFPYPTSRWNTIGSDIYGIGPGSRALPDIKRLQEMEKAFLMATHKSINPPLNAPGKMRGKLNTLPGGRNYYSNPNETVTSLYDLKFEYTGVSAAIERVENRLEKVFFNDIFLTGSRDPNASPLRTGQVNAMEQEKMLRLGPVIERLQHEFLTPIIERCFNILLRKNLLPQLSPELIEMVGDYTITLTSPLAVAQKSVALNSINSFFGFLGNIAQFDPTVMDNVNPDEAAKDVAEITGVRVGVRRSSDEVKSIRANRQQAAAKEKAKEDAAAAATTNSAVNASDATAQKAQSEAGLNLLEGQQISQEMGQI